MLPEGHDGGSRFLLGRCFRVLVSSHIGSLQSGPAVYGGTTRCVKSHMHVGRVNAVTMV